jgi:hypothetical protein
MTVAGLLSRTPRERSLVGGEAEEVRDLFLADPWPSAFDTCAP